MPALASSGAIGAALELLSASLVPAWGAGGLDGRIESVLYLMRPTLSVLLLGLTAYLWSVDRRQSRERALSSSLLPVRAGGWWIEVHSAGLAHSVAYGTCLAVDRELTLGREPGCDLVFEDPAVAARHLHLVPSDDGCRMEPVGDGALWVNGELVTGPVLATQAVHLKLGERVTVKLQRAPRLRG